MMDPSSQNQQVAAGICSAILCASFFTVLFIALFYCYWCWWFMWLMLPLICIWMCICVWVESLDEQRRIDGGQRVVVTQPAQVIVLDPQPTPATVVK